MYFMNSAGKMQTGWINDNGIWYYPYPSGAMANGWLLEGDAWYYLQPSGAMSVGDCLTAYFEPPLRSILNFL